jgi:hypothetical protein
VPSVSLVETSGTFTVASTATTDTDGTPFTLTTITRAASNWHDDHFLAGHLVRIVGDGKDQSVCARSRKTARH